jgi:hypothetical protein
VFVVADWAAWGVKIWGRPEAEPTVRLEFAGDFAQIGGIWGPLLPALREIQIPRLCDVESGTFIGINMQSLRVGGKDTAEGAGLVALGFDMTAWKVTFTEAQAVADALARRQPDDIFQAAGDVPPEVLTWPHLKEWGTCAFAFANFRKFASIPR